MTPPPPARSPLSLEVRLAAIAHEVATPIAIAAQGAAELAERAAGLEGGEAIRSAAAEIERNLARAGQLLATFKRAAAGEGGGARLTFALAGCVRDALATLGPALRRARASVEVVDDPERGAPGEITSDPGAIAQVVLNLVLNAAQHAYRGPDGGARRIEVRVGGASFTVRDWGRGLAPEVRERLFEPFQTSDRAGGGTGLGLTIVRDLVEGRLGGTVSVESEGVAGKGTIARVTLPAG